MKLYKNITRFQFRRMFPKGSSAERKLLWGASLRVGDVISSCTGFNVRITKITPHRCRAAHWFGRVSREKEGWFIDGFIVEEADGRLHYTDSCCWKPESVESIEKYWSSPTDEFLVDEEARGWASLRRREFRDILRAGGRICDENGVMLPELKRT